MTTYTIATTIPESDGSCLLLATVPDGGDIEAAVAREAGYVGSPYADLDWESEEGLTLTNDEPEDEARIAWQGHDCGWLIDEHDRTWEYAVRS